MPQREIARAAERTAAAEVEREALLAEGDASRAQDAVTMAKKGGEIEALRAQAAGMAALTKYATMEAAWVEEREEGAEACEAEEERRELAKTAARVGDARQSSRRRAIVLVEARRRWRRSGGGGRARGELGRRARRRRRRGRARRRRRRDCGRRGRRRVRATRRIGSGRRMRSGRRCSWRSWEAEGGTHPAGHRAVVDARLCDVTRRALYAMQRRLRRQIGGASAEPLSGDEAEARLPAWPVSCSRRSATSFELGYTTGSRCMHRLNLATAARIDNYYR